MFQKRFTRFLPEAILIMKLYVGNLPFKVSEDAIRAHFEPYGTVTDVAIILENGTGRSRGFGFVTMENAEGGQAAIAALNGKPFESRNLIINEARAREERPPRPERSGGGGYGDRRENRDRRNHRDDNRRDFRSRR